MFQNRVYRVPTRLLAVLLICRPLVKGYWGEGHNGSASLL
jgi:hypothetical protein